MQNFMLMYIIWIRHSLQASIASTHRHVHVHYPVNSIAKGIFWAEIYRGRLFFRADRSLGAKQEGLTTIGKPRVSPLRFLNTSAVIR